MPTLPPITVAPAVPSRGSSPATFNADADTYFTWVANLAGEINAFGTALPTAVLGIDFTGTSATSIAIGTGAKSFTASTGKLWYVGQPVRVSYTTTATNYMDGQVTAYNSSTGALTVNVTGVGGTGTFAAWTIGPLPGAGSFATVAGAETLTNKTLTTPVISPTAAGATAGQLGYSGGNLTFGNGSATRTVFTTSGGTLTGALNGTTIYAEISSGAVSPLSAVSNLASLPSASFTNNGAGSSVLGVTSSITSGGNNTSSYHYAGVTQSVALWYLYGNGTTSYTSDLRTKENIKPARAGYLGDIMALRVVKFDRREPGTVDLFDTTVHAHKSSDPEPTEIGLLAQEVEAIFPELVVDALHNLDGTLDDGPKTKVLKADVLYGPILLKAVQELALKVEALEARIDAMGGA